MSFEFASMSDTAVSARAAQLHVVRLEDQKCLPCRYIHIYLLAANHVLLSIYMRQKMRNANNK